MSHDADLDAALQTFFIECGELLQDMETCLLALENGPASGEGINAIFRAAHTIKGSAGLFGLNHIVAFAHVVENVLDALREGALSVQSDLVALLLECRDHLGVLISRVESSASAEDPALSAVGDALLARLRPYLAMLSDPVDAQMPGTSHTRQVSADHSARASTPEPVCREWTLALRFGADTLRNGMDPLAFIRYLASMGTIDHLETQFDALPEAHLMDAESCYVAFKVLFRSTATQEAIANVFEFVREDSDISITPAHSGEPLRHEMPSDVPSSNAHPLPVAAVRAVSATQERAQPQQDTRSRENQTLRVDAARLDKLIDLVGELVIAGSGASLRARKLRDTVMLEATADVMQLVEQVRDSAMQLRMVPVGSLFGRFQRVVRDLGAELGKEIDLVITGGETEVDKSLVEGIADPLMHLVRNSVDHGISAPAQRRAEGKPVRGRVSLNAYHESGAIVIEIADDGAGLNRTRILAKAVERGLVSATDFVAESEIDRLIFEPGLSTAAEVSAISGRGVGMDVVRRNVAALRGTIDVESHTGVGTTFRMRLPLTLAIIDGFLVEVGEASFVTPLDRVLECVELPEEARTQHYMNLRGEVLPFVRLRDLFDIKGSEPARQNVLVVQHDGKKTGVVVDRLIGEFQTVIKPLGALFNHVEGIGGSTILGSGAVALILDVPGLIQFHIRQEMQTNEPNRLRAASSAAFLTEGATLPSGISSSGRQ